MRTGESSSTLNSATLYQPSQHACFAAAAVAVLLVLASQAARAQHSATATTIEAALDARSPLAGAAPGQRTPTLHTTSLRAHTRLGAGFSAQVYVADKNAGARVQEATLEKEWTNGQRFAAGIIRVPFGVYDGRETYRSGLIDYALPRVDYALNAVDWGVPGAQWTGGTPFLQVEAAAFKGRAAGVWSNTNDVDGRAVRLQTFVSNLVLGASRWDGHQSTTFTNTALRPVHLNGLDGRWTPAPRLLVRGEYLWGTLGGEAMKGAYLDAYLRVPGEERVTLVARAEFLRPGPDDPAARQLTLGARYTASPQWTVALNWRKNNLNRAYARS